MTLSAQNPSLSSPRLLEQLVAFDTTSHLSNRACISFMADILQAHGARLSVINDAQQNKACLWASFGPAGDGGVVLSGHTDVVPTLGQKWDTDPFKLTEKSGRLYGRGSCDMKGFVANCLALAPLLAQSTLKTPVHMAFTYDEETNMAGVRRLMQWLQEQSFKPRWVWVGEPTELQLVNSHKGVMDFQTRIEGHAAHSSQPHLGLSAVQLAAEIALFIGQMAAERASKAFADSGFTPPFTTFNVGMLNGGTAINIIADKAELRWEFRLHPGDDAASIRADYAQFIAHKIQPQLARFAKTANITTEVMVQIPPLVAEAQNPGEILLQKITGANQAGVVSFATEAGYFQEAGMSVIICGPGSIEQAHQPNEFVATEQLLRCDTLLQQMVQQLCR